VKAARREIVEGALDVEG